MDITNSGKGQLLYKKAKKIIPGGTQLLSKRPEMFLPEYWPAYYSKAKGCKIWDLDGNEYIDVSYMGIGANVLGYANDEVDAAAKEAIDNGGMTTLNAPEEVALAEKLLELHPWAGGVRFAKAGGEAMALASRIARASTKKDIILFCGYHGWHDWYLAANLANKNALDDLHIPGLEPLGVPSGLAGTNLPFHYNNIDEFNALMAKHRGKIAAVVMEPIRNDWPKDNFLQKIREATEKEGIVLVFDEVSAGFRLCAGGSHRVLGVHPDIAVFAKGMTNGYPLTAIVGRHDVMDAAQGTFISSTFYTERVAFAATLKSIEVYERERVGKAERIRPSDPGRLESKGCRSRSGSRDRRHPTHEPLCSQRLRKPFGLQDFRNSGNAEARLSCFQFLLYLKRPQPRNHRKIPLRHRRGIHADQIAYGCRDQRGEPFARRRLSVRIRKTELRINAAMAASEIYFPIS